MNKYLVTGMTILTGAAMALGCAAVYTNLQYGQAQDQCIAEAGTKSQADDCRCQVRQKYPTANQCTPLSDGGWILPNDISDSSPNPTPNTKPDTKQVTK